MWITAHIECMNVCLDSANEKDSMEKLFVSKPVAIGYNIVNNPDCDISNLEKDGYTKCLLKITLNGL